MIKVRTIKEPGYLVKCDRCDAKRYADQCTFDVFPNNHLFVCKDTCLDKFNHGDKVYSVPDYQEVPIARPEHSPDINRYVNVDVSKLFPGI